MLIDRAIKTHYKVYESFKITNIDIAKIDNVHIVLELLLSIGTSEIASTLCALFTAHESGLRVMDGKIKIEKPTIIIVHFHLTNTNRNKYFVTIQ